MSKLLKKSNFLSAILILVLIGGLAFRVVYATTLTSMSNTMTRLRIGVTADHTVRWTLPTGVTFAAGDRARVDFPDAFVTSGTATWTVADFTFNDGNARTITAVAINADPTCTGGGNNVSVRINDATDEFIVWACTGYTPSAGGAAVTFGILGTGPNGTLTNPATAATYLVDLVGDDKGTPLVPADDDTGRVAVPVITDDQVVVTATVDPVITFILSANSVSLGTLVSTAIRTGQITVTTGTNALSGFSTTVLENHNLRIGATAHDINDADTDNDVDLGVEEYGMSTTDTGQDMPTDTALNCSPTPPNPKIARAIDTTARTVAGAASGPVNETNTLCFAASITALTTAGNYGHTLTFVSTATF